MVKQASEQPAAEDQAGGIAARDHAGDPTPGGWGPHDRRGFPHPWWRLLLLSVRPMMTVTSRRCRARQDGSPAESEAGGVRVSLVNLDNSLMQMALRHRMETAHRANGR